MATPYICRALDIYAQSFQRLFEPICIEWSPRLRRFVYNSDPKSLAIWRFNIMFFVLFCTFGSSIVLLAREIFLPQASLCLVNVIAIIIVWVFSIFAVGVYKILMLHSSECIQGWNELKLLECRIRNGQ
jgi:hypothetical protein